MNINRFVIALTVVNLASIFILLIVIAQLRPAFTGEVIRARSFEIVDGQGRVRASLTVIPADPSVTFEGQTYPETVLLRLIDEHGRPNVKLSASQRGGILVVGGASDPTYAQIGADATSGWIRLVNTNGREQIVRP